MKQPTLFDLPPPGAEPVPPDQAARDFAVDPANDVVLEASAGTGKTRVLVTRYVRLIQKGVDPRHILAVTFTRKAAAEMRGRVLAALRRAAADGTLDADIWRDLRGRLADIEISTIDAFCYALLREFPLEADVDPGLDIADETEMARFASEALDLTLRAARRLIVEDEAVRLLFARVKLPVLRQALSGLLDRRQVALPAVAAFVARGTGSHSAAEAGATFLERLGDRLGTADRRALLDDGPGGWFDFAALRADLADPSRGPADDPATIQRLRRRLERHFLTTQGQPRRQLLRAIPASAYPSADARRRHEAAVRAFAPDVLAEIERLDADVNGLLARGLLRVLTVAVSMYERLLEEHALLDFAGLLDRAVRLLERQEEFARSRLKLQARYRHLLVDEFQDTSRRQWRLIERLVDAWGEGEGVADAPTSIFVVGDRKQSIYRFRHAEVTLLDEAARKIAFIRPGRPARQAITASFRAVPELLAFVNAASSAMAVGAGIDGRFTYGETDRFPVGAVAPGARRDGRPVLGLIAERSMEAAATAVAAEVARVVGHAVVRDRQGAPRPARPEDVAILFRARAGHQYFEDALETRGIRTYVYKGLGFFDAPEVQDLEALLRYLAEPVSDLRAAELLRSRLLRVSDAGLTRLAPGFAAALAGPDPPAGRAMLDEVDARVLDAGRALVARALAGADRLPPGELLDLVLAECAYAHELGGRRLAQARENVKKLRALVRRVENRGYATLGRLAAYVETLRAGEESNAIIEASGAVSLMTIHAAKGLEYPIVFVVNLHLGGRGRAGGVTVIDRGPTGEPEVAFATSDATRLEDERDTEEQRRLLYVAMTRARDRLYLAGEVDDSRKLRRPARSLASLLPAGLADLFTLAAASDLPEVSWATGDGTFDFTVCRVAEPAAPEPAAAEPVPDADAEEPSVDVTAVMASTRSVVGAAALGAAGGPATSSPEPAARSDRLVGRLVHRLFERRLDPAQDPARLTEAARRLLDQEERVDVADPAALATEAADLYRALGARPDVAGLLAAGNCHYELPFSWCPPDQPGVIVRGVVDCLVARPDGRAVVVEFKTGAPRPEHDTQVAVYVRALAAALPDLEISGKIVYP